MEAIKEGDDDDRPFSADERRELRELLEGERRVKWIWSSARTWAAWIAAALTTAFILTESIIKWLPFMSKKVGP